MIAVISLEHVAWLALLIACMALSALLSGMETGLYVLNKIRLDLRAEAGSRRARILRDMLSNPGDLLATLLVGNNIANYGATFAVSAMYLLSGVGGSKAEFYTLATVTPLLFIMCESIPKSVFQRLAETVVYRLAVLLSAIRLVLNALGLVWMVQRLSHLLLWVLRVGGKGGGQPLARESLLSVMVEGHASGVLTHLQSVMAQRVMNIAHVTLANVMIPMAKVVKADVNIGEEPLRRLIGEQNHSRLPLTDAAGQVAGIVDIYDVLAAEGPVDLANLASKPLVLPADLTITEALYRMQRAGASMAVVADAGRHGGIVTIKDLVGQIVGELEAW